MHLFNITTYNLEQETIPCVDLENPNNDELFSYNRKWLMARIADGMVIKKMDTSFDAFIEYLPAEQSWKPVFAPGYVLINHIYIAKDYPDQRLKSELIQHCETENSNKNGIVVVLDNEDFRLNRHFFIERGYLEYGHLPGFTLLVKKFRPEAPTPLFVLVMDEGTNPPNSHAITITYANQSSFINYYIYEMKNVFEDMGFEVELKELHSASEAWESGSPYGTFGVFLDGHFLTHKLLNRNETEALIGSLDLDKMYPEFKNLGYESELSENPDFAHY